MSERAVESGPAGQPSGAKRNPLIRRDVLNRALVTGVAVTAATFLGAGTAAASEPLVTDDAIGVVEAAPGQEIELSASAMDSKVRDAVLLAIPLAFDDAKEASEQFEAQSPITLGTAEEGTNSFSGSEIADAAKPRIAELGLPEDKVEAVSSHFNNLVSIGNSLTVRAEEPEEEPPPSSEPRPEPEPQPAPEPEPEPAPAPPPTSESPEPAPEPAAPSAEPVSAPTPSAYPGYGARAPVRVTPPDYEYVPGSVPPWAKARHGQTPPPTPDVADLLERPAEQRQPSTGPSVADPGRMEQERVTKERQQEVRAAGNAEAMPADSSNRVQLPVLIGAVSLAAVTAALVRTWVLRRN